MSPVDCFLVFIPFLPGILTQHPVQKSGDSVFGNISLPVSEVQAILEALDPGKVTSPDSVLARSLKDIPSVIVPSLCKLFSRSAQEGSISSEWKLLSGTCP